MKIETQTTKIITLTQSEVIEALTAYVEMKCIEVEGIEIDTSFLPESIILKCESPVVETINTDKAVAVPLEPLVLTGPMDVAETAISIEVQKPQVLTKTDEELFADEPDAIVHHCLVKQGITPSIFDDEDLGSEPNISAQSATMITEDIFA